MAKLGKLIVKINESINNQHYVSTSYDGVCWGGTPSYTNEELKQVADEIYKFLGLKK